ncbi:hypothetical protein B1H21_06340 [Enterobacter roggenkampii]|nr:hypothetical protein B1H21_06340 [Enterobacter roggenkampii]
MSFTKHAFDKIFPVPQFTFNHNNLSYYYAHSTKTYHHCEDYLTNCCDCTLRPAGIYDKYERRALNFL